MGGNSTVTITSFDEGEQRPLEIVHLNVYDKPVTSPVAVVAAAFGLVMVAIPDTTLQTPVPVIGVFALKLATALQIS